MSGGGQHSVDAKVTWSGGLDPRVRLVIATVFAFVVVSLSSFPALASGLLLSLLALAFAGVSARSVFRRLFAIDVLMLLVVATLPFAIPGEPLLQWGSLAASREGALRAAEIVLKANAVALMLLALLEDVSTPALGHALQRLGLPDRLVHVLFFTIRYLDVVGGEYQRLRRAMIARAFRPRTDWHTWRTFGWLVGMVLVRSFERAERVLAAMRCRGFDGRLHSYAELRLRPADGVFVLASCVMVAMLLWLERA